MFKKAARIASVFILIGMGVFCADPTTSQEAVPPPIQVQPAPLASTSGSEVPKGVEVLARGPVHEAFASPLTEPKATPVLAKKPPQPIEEMPPEDRPEGDAVWIGGYWAWDDDRADFLWVSGCWRVRPAGKEWVPGYWRANAANWQWVSGFWTAAQEDYRQGVTYYPEPPAPPNIAPPGEPPQADAFYIPGYWMWSGTRYAWRAGYWARVRPGHIYVSSHYRWTPSGYVFVSGYWDYAVSRRGVLYAPITVNIGLVGPRYVYTPYYAVRDTIVLDTLFVRPAFGAYYFGDYYGPRYVSIGFEPVVVFARRRHDPIIAYERYVYRDNPRWLDTRVTLVIERNAGRAPVPPRTLVQQTTIIQKNVTINNVTKVTNVTNVLAPTRTVVAASGGKSVPLSTAARVQVRNNTQVAQRTLAAERQKLETGRGAGTPLTRPQSTALKVPATTPRTGVKGGNVTLPKTKITDRGRDPFTTRDRPGIGTTPRDKGKGGPIPLPKKKKKL
ncbi:MAG: YXWGXW repeat-containing protein [Planctomycetes bacterium]|nr:YXWGXW repeat-containing protein [Planctomycetota bacterium]